MKTLWMAGAVAWNLIKWLGEVKRQGKLRLAADRAQQDRLALERIFAAMARGQVMRLPCWLQWLCKWLDKIGVLNDIGRYGQNLLKSAKLETDDPVLYRAQ